MTADVENKTGLSSPYAYIYFLVPYAVLVILILSVRLSVTRVLCDETKENTADILISHESLIALLFLHQKPGVERGLTGDTDYHLKFATVTHPFEKRRLQLIYAYSVSTVRATEKKVQLSQIESRPRAF